METPLSVFRTLAGLAGENSPGLCQRPHVCQRHDVWGAWLGTRQAQGAEPQPSPSSPSIHPEEEKSNLYFCGYISIQKISPKTFWSSTFPAFLVIFNYSSCKIWNILLQVLLKFDGFEFFLLFFYFPLLSGRKDSHKPSWDLWAHLTPPQIYCPRLVIFW